MSETVQVVVRVRPMNSKQIQRGCFCVTNVDPQNNQISLLKPEQSQNVKNFAFDHVFGQQSHQESVYTKTAYSLVQNVLLGYNGTIFAYGQTGCGKTHSMVGKVQSQDLQGIIPRSFGHILKTISETKDKQFLIRCSFIEIYNEEVRDLLAKDVKAKLQIKQSTEKGIFIKDLSMNTAKTHEDLMEFMMIGNKNRSTGETAMNKDSSRSHLLFMLYLESAETIETGQKRYVASKLNLVDLAGSERLSKTGAAGDRLKQAQKINLSLSALGNVISALVDGKSHHIPYRDSKLTRLLQDSLGGNTKTVMIANCSPADYNYDETLSTLRYASRAKFIKNKPIINEDPKDALLKEYADQIKKLRMMIQNQQGGVVRNVENMTVNLKAMDQQMNAKLMEKERQLNDQKQEKQKLLQKIRQLEANRLQAKDVHIDEKTKDQLQKAKVEVQHDNEMMQSFKGSKQKEEQEQQVNVKGKSEKQIIDSYKSVVKKLKKRVRDLQLQIKDINHENYLDKQILLDDIRSITKENKFLQGVINVLMLPGEIETVRNSSQYNLEKAEYKIPPFHFKNKELAFPKLPENQAIEMIKQLQEGRVLNYSKFNTNQQGTFQSSNQSNKNNSTQIRQNLLQKQNLACNSKSTSDLSVRQIIKQARNSNSKIAPIKDEKKMMRKMQLQPIRRE